jgi:serine/threonine-protein kinase
MVSGKQAFSAPTMQALLTQVLTGPRPRLSTIAVTTPPEVDSAVQRALAQDPKARFPDVMAFASALVRESSGAAAATRESRRWKRLAVVLPLLVAIAAAAWFALAGPKRYVVSGAETIAVVPFSTSGTDVATLGEGMVDLVGGNLDGVGPIRIIEARQVIRAWQRRVKGGGSATVDDAIAIGKNVKAASVLLGNIVSTGGNARITAELYDLSGKQLARAQVDGKSDSVLVLADRLALEVLRNIWKSREPLPSARASAINSTSVEAIRSYLDGERWFRSGVWDSATIAYQHAVQSDSTFAIAWYKLATALGWQAQITTSEATGASANAVKYSEGLSPRLHTIMVAYQMFQHGSRAAVDSMQVYTAKYPDDADGWDLLGEAQYHSRGIVPLTPAELVAPFDHVIAIDSSLAAAAIHPMEIALQESDTALIRKYLHVFQSARADAEFRHAQAGLALLSDPKARVDTLFPKLEFSSEARATLVGLMLSPRRGSIEEVEQALSAAMKSAAAGDRMQLLGMLGMVRGGTGQQDGARAISDSVRSVSQDSYEFLRMIPFYGNFAADTLQKGVRTALTRAPAGNPFVELIRGVLAYDTGDIAHVGPAVQAGLEAAAGPNNPPWLRGALIGLDGLRMVAQGDTLKGLARADSGLRAAGGFGNPAFVAMIALRVAQVQVAYVPTRSAGLKRLQYGFQDRPELLPIIQYDLAKVYESMGDKPKAVAAYGQFVRLWSKADRDYQPRVKEARDALQRLTSEGAR